MSANDPRHDAYLRGELSLEEARAYEAEIAMSAPDAPPPSDVQDALCALDAVERRRLFQRRPRRWVVPALLLAAALALVTWAAWPPAEAPQIVKQPVPVPPATRLAEPDTANAQDSAVVAAPDSSADAGPDTALAIHDAAETHIAFVDNGVIGAKNGRRLTIEVARSPWRAGHRDGPPVIEVAAHPRVETLVTSGLLDHIVGCAEKHWLGSSGLGVAVSLSSGKSPDAVVARSSDPDLALCIETFAVDPSIWKTSRFELTLARPRSLGKTKPGGH